MKCFLFIITLFSIGRFIDTHREDDADSNLSSTEVTEESEESTDDDSKYDGKPSKQGRYDKKKGPPLIHNSTENDILRIGCFCLSNMAFIWPNVITLMVIWERPGLGQMKWRLWRGMVLIGIGLFIFIAGSVVNAMELVSVFIQINID